MKLKTPYKDLVPPLSTEEKDSLKADIHKRGIMIPLFIDEENNILDGHHRHELKKRNQKVPTVVVEGLTEREKVAFVYRSSNARRNLSPDQKAVLRAAQQEKAIEWNQTPDPETGTPWTQARIAEQLGVSQQCVAKWFTTITTSGISGNGKTKKKTKKKVKIRDNRVKISPDERKEAYDRSKAGESQSQIAADLGVSQQAISKAIDQERKEREKETARKKATASAKRSIKNTGKGNENGVFHGDAFELAKSLPDACCPLIFTDPPYDKKSLPLYDSLAQLADRILVPGGSLITYLGQYALHDVVNSLCPTLKFFWTICCQHTGGTSQMSLFGIKVKWKPMLWFVKGTNRRDTTIWVDDLVISKQEKDSHEWQQSLVESSYYIDKLTLPGELVVDPFCGGGTTSVAAKTSGRQWWTADVDATCVADTRRRLNAIGK